MTAVELTLRRRSLLVHGGAAAVAAVGLWLLPYWKALAPSDLRLVAVAMMYATAVMGLNLVFGLAGQVTLGPAAVFAVGAYVSGLLSANKGWDPFPAIAAGVVAAALVGLVIGVPAVRVGGFYLAMITAFAADAVPATVKLHPGATGGESGLTGIRPLGWGGEAFDRYTAYRVVLVVLLVTAVLVANVARTSWGRWMRTVHQSEVGTSALGVSVYRVKLEAFVLSAVFGGLAGGLYAHYQLIIDPRQFTFELSLILFSALVIGGLGSMWGPVLGTFLYVLGPHYLLPEGWGSWTQVLYGSLLIGLMIAIPDGLVAGLGKVAGPLRRRLDRPDPPDAQPRVATADALRPLLTRAREQEPGRVVLAADAVTRRFGGVVALDRASVRVEAGRITALIGPNGSGKTTLLNVCSGYLGVDAGRVELDSHDVTRIGPNRRAARGLARTFQGTIVFPGLTGTQSVMAGYAQNRPSVWGAMVGSRRSRRHERDAAARAEALLVALGVGHLVGRPAGAGTLGDDRIVALARALALDPLVLLLDEPAAGLDLGEVAVLESVVRCARDAGVGVLLVEHDVAFVTRLADTVTVLDRGRVIYDGPAAGVRDDPAVGAAYFGELASA